MTDDSPDPPLLEDDQRAIELLASETQTPIERVREVYVKEYRKLAEGAHVKAYLPLLTGNVVRRILTDQNARRDALAKL